MKNSNNNNVLSKKNKSVLRIAASAKPVLLLLVVTSLTVPVMFSSLPLAAADEKADCDKSGGTLVTNAAGQSHCFVTLEPICNKLPAGDVVPDPELCLKSGGIVSNPISVGDEIAATVEDTLEEIMPVVSDGDKISESVRNTLEEIMPLITDGND